MEMTFLSEKENGFSNMLWCLNKTIGIRYKYIPDRFSKEKKKYQLEVGYLKNLKTKITFNRVTGFKHKSVTFFLKNWEDEIRFYLSDLTHLVKYNTYDFYELLNID